MKRENTPVLETERLILRKFTMQDVDAVYRIFSDVEVNTFLPWFPIASKAEAEKFLYDRYLNAYRQPEAYAYAICLKCDNQPIGYIHAETKIPYDFGYGLCKAFWHKGILTEAGTALIKQLRKDGIPYITATHDINNPRSGEVMKRLGMQYRYSYVEQWQPKNLTVTFRMYQMNLCQKQASVYFGYWDMSEIHFIEASEAAASCNCIADKR